LKGLGKEVGVGGHSCKKRNQPYGKNPITKKTPRRGENKAYRSDRCFRATGRKEIREEALFDAGGNVGAQLFHRILQRESVRNVSTEGKAPNDEANGRKTKSWRIGMSNVSRLVRSETAARYRHTQGRKHQEDS